MYKTILCDDDWSKKNVIGMKSGKLMGISVMHSFRSDPDMGIGQIGARRIPCACNGCLENFDSVWKTVTIDQEKGRLNTIDRYEMKAIFDDLND